MTLKLTLAALAGAVALAGPVLAQTGTPVDPASIDVYNRMNKAVNTKVFEHLHDLLEPQDKLRLLLVAHQRVLAENCEGFAVDEAKFGTVMADILSGLTGLTEEGQNNLPVDVSLMSYSIAVGGLTAIASYDRVRFCEPGDAFREDLADEGEVLINILASAE